MIPLPLVMGLLYNQFPFAVTAARSKYGKPVDSCQTQRQSQRGARIAKNMDMALLICFIYTSDQILNPNTANSTIVEAQPACPTDETNGQVVTWPPGP